MIILDYSGLVFGAIHTDLKNSDDINENFIRHLILNRIRMFNKKYRDEYGEMVITLDCTHGKGNSNWRYDYFKHYKHKRKVKREESKIDWGKIFSIIGNITQELKQYFPYRILEVPRCEADDIIGWLCENKDMHEPVMIVSGDKDFRQLQRYPGVKQFSPIIKKQLVEKYPLEYIKEHTIRGDKSDGVPNVLSVEDAFTIDGYRQKAITKKLLADWMPKPLALITQGDAVLAERFETNKQMIDLSLLPHKYKEKIREAAEAPIRAKANRLYSYFMKNKMKILLDSIDDFFGVK